MLFSETRGFKVRFMSLVLALTLLAGLFTGVTAARAADIPSSDSMTFGVITDIHVGATGYNTIGQDVKLAKTLDWYNNQGIDFLAMTGDLTDSASPEQFDTVKNVIDDHLSEDIQLIATIGNHDTKIKYPDKAEVSEQFRTEQNMFYEATGSAPNYHYVINGYHVIAISPSYGAIDEEGFSVGHYGNDGYFASNPWIQEQLAIAADDDPSKPIFVFFHHPAKDTSFGSDDGYGTYMDGRYGETNPFEGYPQVVAFTGHNHYPNNDPRSIWQDGGYTAVNVGALYYHSMEVPGVPIVGDNPDVRGTSSHPVNTGSIIQGLKVSVEGSVVEIKTVDILNDRDLGQVWTFDTNQPLPYTSERANLAQKPVFSTSDDLAVEGGIELSNISERNTTVTFKQAAIPDPDLVGETVQYYRYDFINRETGDIDLTFNQFSDFMFGPLEPTYTQNVNDLPLGTAYELRIAAVGTYGLESDQYLTKNFVAGVVDVRPSAFVERLSGNRNNLTITIVEELADGTSNEISETFSINNNAADTYEVGFYNVYVDTKGNTDIRECAIVE